MPKTKTIKGNAVNPAEHSRSWYYRRLRLLVDAMDGRTRVYFKQKGETLNVADFGELEKLRTKFLKLFDEEARPLATEFFAKNIRYTKAAFRAAVKPILEEQDKDAQARKRKKMASRYYEVKIDAKKDKLELAQFAEGIEDNVALIKTIPRKYFGKVETAVKRHANGKLTRGAFVKRLKEIGGITQRRAEMIADDQAAKAVEKMTLARCRNAGVKRVMWIHSAVSKKPRDYHKRKWDGHTGKFNGKPNGLNGYVFNIDKPPVIDPKSGERGYPSQLINCKCRLAPVIEL